MLELDGFANSVPGLPGVSPVQSDLWNGAEVTGHSGVVVGSTPRNLFGGAFGTVEGSVGKTLFRTYPWKDLEPIFIYLGDPMDRTI